MQEALSVLVGPEAKGLSPGMIRRLKESWLQEYSEWKKRRLDKDRWVYLWADGIYSGIRASSERLCALVIVGVNDRGEKHFLAIEDGMRESIQSWKDVLLDLKERGLSSPKLAIWDSAGEAERSSPIALMTQLSHLFSPPSPSPSLASSFQSWLPHEEQYPMGTVLGEIVKSGV